jgi:hypothetical protein
LSKGLQYNLHYKTKDWFKMLALEADTAVQLADPNEQNYLRYCDMSSLGSISIVTRQVLLRDNEFVPLL